MPQRRVNRTKGFSLRWTKHLKTEDERKEFEKLVKNTTIVLGRLREILGEELAELEVKEASISAFDEPNWELRQAFQLGMKSMLRKIDQLLL